MKNSNLYRLVPSGSGEIEDEVIQCSSNGQDSPKPDRDKNVLNMQIWKNAGPNGVETLIVDPDTGSIVPIVELHKRGETPPYPGASPTARTSELNLRSLLTVFLLFFINLINYIDRYTTAGVLKEIIYFYDIPDSQAGLLQVSSHASGLWIRGVITHSQVSTSLTLFLFISPLKLSDGVYRGLHVSRTTLWVFGRSL